MARVGISGDLLARTREKIKGMEKVEISLLGEYHPPTLRGDEPDLLQAIWGDKLHLKDVIPKNWCGETAGIKGYVTTNVEDGEDKDGVMVYKRYGIELKLSDKVIVPPRFDHWTATDLSNMHCMRGAIEHGSKVAEIQTRWADINKKVIEFLSSCKSLNEAVKLWEEIKFYIHDDDLKRLETKTSSNPKESKAAEILASINKDELVGAAVIARMASGGV